MSDLFVVITEGAGAGSEHPLSGELTVGRDATAGLPLQDPGISRRHAEIRVEDGRVVIEDLGSANGTFVNGERIRGPVEVADGDEIQLGGTVLTTEGADPATALMGAGAATEEHPGPAARRQPPPARRAAPGRLAPHPQQEGNIPALASLFLGPLSIFLLLFSSGAAFFVSLPCAVAAIVLGNIGMRKVDRGETDSHRAFANLGRITGIIGAILSTLALVAFLLVSALLDATEDNLGGLIDRIQEEIEGVDIPDAPDVESPEVEQPGGDSGGVEAP